MAAERDRKLDTLLLVTTECAGGCNMLRNKVKLAVRKSVGRMKAVTSVARHGTFVPPGHFYSPITSPSDVKRLMGNVAPPLTFDIGDKRQLELLDAIRPVVPESKRWPHGNSMFNNSDAGFYSGMIKHFRPAKILEVGSGYSTGLALDVIDAYDLDTQVVCVEPFPDRLQERLSGDDFRRIRLLQSFVQDVPLEGLVQELGAGDFFFIDSTHVVKPGSDVAHLVLNVLPRLPAGVFVHVHDVHWPFEYPQSWLKERRDWTEAYLLRAFLQDNESWQVALFGSWIQQEHPELLPDSMLKNESGSIWLHKVR